MSEKEHAHLNTPSSHDLSPRDTDVAERVGGGASRAPSGQPSMLANAAVAIGGGALQRKLQRRAVQRREAGGAEAGGGEASMIDQARRGTEGAGGALPHLDAIQRSFGRHDVSHVQAHTGEAAASSAKAIGAEAYAFGDSVAFAGAPSLHTTAHEAAHVVQQRAGVHLAGGVGHEGDTYEQHADAVADKVVRGESAEALLDQHAPAQGGGGGAAAGVQRKIGYEYETNVQVRKNVGNDQQMLNKGDVLASKKGVEMQVDTNPVDGSNIEFVSEAFDVNKAGRKQAKESLTKLVDWTDRIDKASSKVEKREGGFDSPFKPLSKYVSGTDPQVVVRSTTREMHGNPQITAGLSLDELHGVLSDYEESGGNENKNPVAKWLFQATVNNQSYKDIFRRARQTKVNPQQHSPFEEPEQDRPLSNALQAMVWIISSYLKTIDGGGNRPFKNSKEITVVLSRNHFGALFQTLPKDEQELLVREPDLLVQAVAMASGSDMSRPVYPHGFVKGSANNRRTIEFALTRDDWVRSMALGQDKLTKAYWEENEGEEDAEEGKELHKSLGFYKDRSDKDRGHDQAVFEFRKIPSGIRPADFKEKMMGAWDYLESQMAAPPKKK